MIFDRAASKKFGKRRPFLYFERQVLRITNATKCKTVAERAGMAKTTLDRMKGLLGRDSLQEGEGLVISPCTSIHTFWMRFAIDAVFFDRKMRVVSVYKGLKPFRASSWHPWAAGVIEVPSGTAGKAGIEAGDQLSFEG